MRGWFVAVAFTALYSAGALLGGVLVVGVDRVVLLWPPAALCLVLLQQEGQRWWLLIAFANAFTTLLLSPLPASFVPFSVVANVVGSLVGLAVAERRKLKPGAPLDLDGVLSYLLCGAALALSSAPIGVAGLVVSGVTPPVAVVDALLKWSMANIFGILVIAPALSQLWPPRGGASPPLRPAPDWHVGHFELVLWATTLAVGLGVVALVDAGQTRNAVAVLSIPTLVLLWGAIRLPARPVAAGALISGVALAVLAALDQGALQRPESTVEALLLLAMLITLTLVPLLLLATIDQVRRSAARLGNLNVTLEQRVAERTRELEVARDEALAAARTRQQIIAGVSHELRTPLVGLLGSLELIAAEHLPPDQQRLVEVARRSGGALSTVIDDVLDFSRLEAVGAALRHEPMRPAEVVTEVVALHASVALRKGLRLTGDADSAAEAATVLGDAARLRQVLLNLVGNAVKFTDRGEVALRVAARLCRDGWFAALRFEVRDTGPGIDAELAARLFTPFVQAAGSETAHRGGTGLGLAISQRLVVAMGGRIEVDSRPGEGACFWFEVELPHALPALIEAPAPGPEQLRGRVLLVEDNPVSRMIASEMLRRIGLEVEEAENGLLALEALRRKPVDLVLMDQEMPVLDGLAAAARIRRGDAGDAARQVPIIAVTANAMQEDIDACLDAGMNGHLAKPFAPRELATRIATWLPADSLKAR